MTLTAARELRSPAAMANILAKEKREQILALVNRPGFSGGSFS